MNPKNKTPAEVRGKILHYQKTKTHAQICELLGVSRSTIYRVICEAMLNNPRDTIRKKLDHRAVSIKRDIKNGLNRKQIAEKYGVSITAINNFARARGITLPDTRKTNASQIRELEADMPLIYEISKGFTPKQLAEKWEVPVEVMHLFLKKHGLETKKAP